MKVYIAGPMTGIPQFNYPQFMALAEELRALTVAIDGHPARMEVVSPAEMDDPETMAAALASPDGAPGSGSANSETWGDFLARDVKLIADGKFDGIVVLPRWEESRGARLETYVAFLAGVPILNYRGHGSFYNVPEIELFRAWTGDRTLRIRQEAYKSA